MVNVSLEKLPVSIFILIDIHYSLRVFIEVKDEEPIVKMKGYVKKKKKKMLTHLKVCQRSEKA